MGLVEARKKDVGVECNLQRSAIGSDRYRLTSIVMLMFRIADPAVNLMAFESRLITI